MRKTYAYLLMGLVVVLLLGADLLILALSFNRLARREMERILGDFVTLEEVKVSRRGEYTVYVRKPKIHLSPERLDTLTTSMPEGALHERISPESLPRVVCEEGLLEVDFPDILREGVLHQTEIRELTLTPTRGYRYYASGLFKSDVLGDWHAHGEVALDTGAVRLMFEIPGLRVGPETRKMLSPRIQKLWDRYKPGGLCDLMIRVVREPGKELDLRVTLRARDMQMVFINFPYPVEKVAGEIDFFPEGFRVKHMTAHRGPVTVRFDGTSDGYNRNAGYAFRIEIDGMELDETLRAALDEKAKRAWDLFAPTGRAEVRGRAERERGPDKKMRLPLDLALSDATFCYKGFPYRLENVTGDLRIDTNDVEIRRLRARQGDALVEMRGRIDDITGDAGVDLVIDTRELPLDARLKAALGEEARKVWERFSPTGVMDVWWHVVKEKGEEPVHTARARALGNTAVYRDVPLPLTELRGEIDYTPNGVTLRHMEGKADGVPVKLHGTVGEKETRLHFDGVSLPLTDKVKDALPEQVGSLLHRMHLGGEATFKAGLILRKEGKGEFDLMLKLSKGVIATKPRVEDIEGTLWLTGFIGDPPQFFGALDFSRMRLDGKRFTDVSSSFNVSGTKINFVNVKATAYDGVVSGRGFSIDTMNGDFRGSFVVDRLDIREYSLDTTAYTEKTLQGKASLEIDVAGRAGDASSVKGGGRLTIRDALLWDIPVFVSLFKLNPQDLFKSRNQFDAGAVDFELRDERFVIRSLLFTSENVNVVGRGHVKFDGNLHLILKAQSQRLLGIDFFLTNLVAKTLDLFTGAFVGVEVTGTFEDPKTSTKSFPGIKR